MWLLSEPTFGSDVNIHNVPGHHTHTHTHTVEPVGIVVALPFVILIDDTFMLLVFAIFYVGQELIMLSLELVVCGS